MLQHHKPASDEELREFAEMSRWLKEHRMVLKSFYTARRKPTEVRVTLLDKRTRRMVATA